MPLPGIRRFESINIANGQSNIATGQSAVPKVHATISNPHHSFYNFGFHTQVPKNIPKLKHTFMVEFVLNKDVLQILSNASRETLTGRGQTQKGIPQVLRHSLESQPYDRELTFAVKSFDRPKINIDIQTLNQYNKKRLIQQQLEYQAVNVRFYDAGDSAAQKLVKEYLQYYFGDQRNLITRDGDNYIFNSELTFARNWASGSGWGFNPLSDELYFFKEINLYQFYGRRRYDKFTYVHPKIQAIDLDTGDYSVSETLEVNLTLMYEGVIIELDKELFPIPTTDATKLNAATDGGAVSDINEKFRFSKTANVPQPNEHPPAEIKSGTLPASISRGNLSDVSTVLTLQNNQVTRSQSTVGGINTNSAIINQNGLNTILPAIDAATEAEFNRLQREERQKESVLTNRAGDSTKSDSDTNDTVDRLEKHNNPDAFEPLIF